MTVKEKARTLYNPGVAMRYVVINTATNEKTYASTLSVRDVTEKPWRTPKGTPKGQEFFKMKMKNSDGEKVIIKFINSVLHEKCLSEDGMWEFTGARPDGGELPFLTIKHTPLTKSITEHKISVNKVDLPSIVSVVDHTPSSEDFCNQEELDRLLS